MAEEPRFRRRTVFAKILGFGVGFGYRNNTIDNWNLLNASCVKCSTINTFKKHLSCELESEVVKFKVCQL